MKTGRLFFGGYLRHPFETDVPDEEQHDLGLMVADLSEVDQQAFRAFEAAQHLDDLALQVTMPESDNPAYGQKTKTDWQGYRRLGTSSTGGRSPRPSLTARRGSAAS